MHTLTRKKLRFERVEIRNTLRFEKSRNLGRVSKCLNHDFQVDMIGNLFES